MNRQAGTLSGGERQMLAEAMVLMRDPKIMMVDEPTAGLMPKLVNDVMKQLKEMADTTGLPVVLVDKAQDLLNHPLLNEMYLGAVDVHELERIKE